MNKRQAKKKEFKSFWFGKDYSSHRKAVREQHEASVSQNRRTYWGNNVKYPNRTRIKQILSL